MIFLAVFMVSLVHIFFAAFQNQNIIYRRRLWIPPSSYCLTYAKATEMVILAYYGAVEQDIIMFLALGFIIGTAGWIASFASMYTHRSSHEQHFGKG